ncbi:MAG: hypothetical protein JWM25_240 [Thermoleophilia bacterium]|nr:hypothetical protein [Thermoleophilia bacterium]MCZ4495657.1 hypothetical protein [Thermoleophilia bacterium]
MSSINPTVATSLPATTALPTSQLASPYDATTPATGTMPITAPTLTGLPAGYSPGSGVPQTNATNQTAIAPNGDVNQQVTNSNQYTNKYYNIIVPNQALGGWGGLGGLGSNPLSSWATQGNSFVDPKTGVLYVQQEQGFTGWLKRLFRGY